MSIKLKHEVHEGGLIHKYTGFAELRRLVDYESKKHLIAIVENEGEMSTYLIDRSNPIKATLQLNDYWQLVHGRSPLYLLFDYKDLLKGA